MRRSTLDETSGTIAGDFSPSKLNGTISSSGVTYGQIDTVAATAVPNGAQRLTTGKVTFPNNAAFNLSLSSTSSWMLMVDIKVNATSGYPSILTKGDMNSNGWSLFADPGRGSVGFKLNGKQYAFAGLSLSTMANLAVNFDGVRLSFFLNGKQVGQTTPSAAAVTNTAPLVLGGSGDITVSNLIVTANANTSALATVYGALTTPGSSSSTNLALRKPVVTSSTETGHEAVMAVDGSSSSRWASGSGDAQWIYVDLGAIYDVNRVKLNWEAAYAKAYHVQVSNDAHSWTTVYSTTNGNGALDDLSGLSASGRYVRMNGIARGTQWGYSLWELEVYGNTKPSSGGDTIAPTVTITAPTAGSTLTTAQTTTMQATATDNVGVTKVEFYDGSVLEGSTTSSPFTYSWSVSASDNGAHSWTAKAYDAAGNSTTSAPVLLDVNVATNPEAAKPVGVPGNWTMVFDDKFSGTSLDTTKWAPNWFNEGGKMNNVGTYAANVAVSGGNMTISSGALELLRSYRWPGNVRELRNVLERAVLLCDASVIGIEHLVFGRVPVSAGSERGARDQPVSPPSSARAPGRTGPTEPPIGEREHVLAVLDQCGGNQTEAAKVLGVTRRILAYRLDKLGIRRPRKGG